MPPAASCAGARTAARSDAVATVLAGFAASWRADAADGSALKHEGERLYSSRDMAKPSRARPAASSSTACACSASRLGWLEFEVECSKGTYMRVLGEDIAARLGTVGHLRACGVCGWPRLRPRPWSARQIEAWHTWRCRSGSCRTLAAARRPGAGRAAAGGSSGPRTAGDPGTVAVGATTGLTEGRRARLRRARQLPRARRVAPARRVAVARFFVAGSDGNLIA